LAARRLGLRPRGECGDGERRDGMEPRQQPSRRHLGQQRELLHIGVVQRRHGLGWPHRARHPERYERLLSQLAGELAVAGSPAATSTTILMASWADVSRSNAWR